MLFLFIGLLGIFNGSDLKWKPATTLEFSGSVLGIVFIRLFWAVQLFFQRMTEIFRAVATLCSVDSVSYDLLAGEAPRKFVRSLAALGMTLEAAKPRTS